MTFKIPRWLAIGLGAFIVVAAVSFGITEWRLQGVADAECSAQALEDYLNAGEKSLDSRPTYPVSPSSSASEAAWETYGDTFARYERDFTSWQNQGDEALREYIDDVRRCL